LAAGVRWAKLKKAPPMTAHSLTLLDVFGQMHLLKKKKLERFSSFRCLDSMCVLKADETEFDGIRRPGRAKFPSVSQNCLAGTFDVCVYNEQKTGGQGGLTGEAVLTTFFDQRNCSE